MAEVIASWFLRRPEELERLRSDLRAYPNLHLFEDQGAFCARGSVALLDGGREIDRFNLDIRTPPDYPDSLSRVYETAHRIPRHADRHVNSDGSLCIGVEEALRLQCVDLRLATLLDGPIKAFLLGTVEAERGHPWPYGSWNHGDDGIRQFYAEHFQVADAATLARLLHALRRTQPKWQKPCPCSSGKRLRECHGYLIQKLRQNVPARIINQSLDVLLERDRPNDSRG
jgi:hypothetical protein